MRQSGSPRARSALFVARLAALALAAGAGAARAGVNFWTPLGPDGGFITVLAVSAAQPGSLYAGNGAGLYRSEDGGATWVRASRGLDLVVTAVLADPRSPGTVYAVGDPYSEPGLMKSVDAGASWISMPPPESGNGIGSLAIDPQSATLYGGADDGVWKSADGGASWTRSGAPKPTLQYTVVAVDPSQPSTIYAFDGRRLLRSADAGATWAEKDTGLVGLESEPNRPQIAFDSSTVPSTVYVAYRRYATTLTYRSADAGESWQPAGPGGYPLAVGQGVVYAGAVKSTDGGATWIPAEVAPGTPQVLAAAPGSATTVYAGTVERGVWKSDDAAASWQAASGGLSATSTEALAIDPSHPRIMYTVVDGGVLGPGLLKTGSGGRRWHLVGPPFLTDYLRLVAVDPSTPTTLYAGSQKGLAKSVDGGITWELLPTSTSHGCFGVSQLVIDPIHSQTLYAVPPPITGSGCFSGCSLLKSTDGGNTWSCMSFSFTVDQLFGAPSDPSTLYAFGEFTSRHGRTLGGFFRSNDAGLTWKHADAGLQTNGGRNAAFVTLAIDPNDANRVFLSEGQGVFRTLDGGRTWVEADGKLPVHDSPLTIAGNLAIDGRSPATIYATGTWGVYRSTNSGRTWYPIVGGLPQFALFACLYGCGNRGVLVLDPQQPGKLYVGTEHTGIYTYTVR